jgi:hypothetical protein
MTFGNLEGGSGGTNKQILEAKPPIFPTFPSELLLKIPRFHCLPLACFIPWMFIHCQIRKRHLTDFSQASLREFARPSQGLQRLLKGFEKALERPSKDL